MADSPPFEDLLRQARRSAVHLETRDSYSTSDPAFIAWRTNGTVDPLITYRPWFDLIDSAGRRGVQIRRARIISEPVSDYIRFEHAITAQLNLAAGEDVRWLPRRRASDIALPGNDYWLFDGELAQLNHFTGGGESSGYETTTDRRLVALCAEAFEAVWARAIPHVDYLPS